MMIAMQASGRDTRVLLEHRAAPRTQLWLFSHKTINDSADIWDFTPAQPKHISCTRHLLVLGAMILLRARICGADQQKHHDCGTPNAPLRRCDKRTCRRDAGFVSHKKVPHMVVDTTAVQRFAVFCCSFPPCTEFGQKRLTPITSGTHSTQHSLTTRLLHPAHAQSVGRSAVDGHAFARDGRIIRTVCPAPTDRTASPAKQLRPRSPQARAFVRN
jgi:hypothetical protein